MPLGLECFLVPKIVLIEHGDLLYIDHYARKNHEKRVASRGGPAGIPRWRRIQILRGSG